MGGTILIVPGLHGSCAAHWQSWLEGELADARRVHQADWHAPVLARWAGTVRDGIDAAVGPVWLVAHSFGCLAAVVAAADRSDKVAGALLVAPADPQRFTALGMNDGSGTSVAGWLPRRPLGFPSMVVASSDDPWMKLTTAAYWAALWGSRFENAGAAGHINVASGHGPWPAGLQLLRTLQGAHLDWPLGGLGESAAPRGRAGALARLRHGTRDAHRRVVAASTLRGGE